MPDLLIATVPKNSREEIRICLSEYRGHDLISLRVWFEAEVGDKTARQGWLGLASWEAARAHRSPHGRRDGSQKPGAAVMSNRLVVLAADIKVEHNKLLADIRSIGERAVAIGNMLIEAKSAVPHGGWLPWLAETGLGERTAQRYMRIAKHGIKPDTVTDFGINKVLATIATATAFDMPEPNTCLILRAQNRIAWIWPDQRVEMTGFYWLLIADLRTATGIGTNFKRPGTPAAVNEILRLDAFPVEEAEAIIDTSGDTTILEEFIIRRLAA